MAGAIPPTEPGPGMFPATAAAWAAAAAWAVAACCCICLWHWRKSNTSEGKRQTLKYYDKTLNSNILKLPKHCTAISPWCKHWGKSCERHLRGHVRPPGPSSSSAQTLHDRSNSAPRRLLHLCIPAGHLCQCGAWEQKEGGVEKHREMRHCYHYIFHLEMYLTRTALINYIMVYV